MDKMLLFKELETRVQKKVTAEKSGIPLSTVSTIIKNQDTIKKCRDLKE